nr:MAG TPA: hypothetical protein [Caudoviricetes sp.]
MIRTNICQKVFDSNADPYIEQKGVILCRSGIQLYSKSELKDFMSDDNKPPKDKEWYREYRPANVVVKAKKLCSNLPVTKEHPDEWVTPDNWKELAGGTTGKDVDVVALDGDSEGEIGLKSDLTFYDKELYSYYEDNNKEVSLGYECRKHWVDNPDELGYDIVLDEITKVNHLAITRVGRGGSSVAVIDSILGGLKPMRTGIFAWLSKGKQKDSAPSSFGKIVFDSLRKSKGGTEEELANDMKGVLDSCAILKDCDEKTTLINAVKDCFDNKDKAIANEDELTKAFDSMYVNISGDSLDEIVHACSKLGGHGAGSSIDSQNSAKEDKEDKEDKEKTDASADKEDKSKEDEDKDSKHKEDKDRDGCNKDSAKPLTADDVRAIVKDSIHTEVASAVKEVLGITSSKDSHADVKGAVIDSANDESENVVTRDYSAFLD